MMRAESIHKRWPALAMVCCVSCLLSPTAAFADSSQPTPSVAAASGTPAPGTNVLGSDDAAAVGLIVLPWKPLPGPNADRSPNLFDADSLPLDGVVLREQIEIDAQRDALLRAQLEQGR